MAQLLPSSPSISTAHSRVLQSSTHSSMGRPVPSAHILPRAKFHPIFRALSRTARCASPPPALFVLLATGTRPCPALSAHSL